MTVLACCVWSSRQCGVLHSRRRLTTQQRGRRRRTPNAHRVTMLCTGVHAHTGPWAVVCELVGARLCA
jgi:hypothetical protein